MSTATSSNALSHNGQFNIRTGEVVMPPCMIPQKTYAVTVEDGKVLIDVV